MNKRIPILLGFILLIIAVWLQVTSVQSIHHFIERLEDIAYDIQLQANIFATSHHPFKTSIAIVDIDDKSLNREGRWPWSRLTLAKLVQRLQEEGAVVIAFDVLFAEKENNLADIVLNKLHQENLSNPLIDDALKKIQPFFDEDSQFAESLTHSDVVLSMTFLPFFKTNDILSPPILLLNTREEKKLNIIELPGVITNTPQLQIAAKNSGFINVFPDDDGIIRRVPLIVRYQNKIYPSLALEAAHLFLLSPVNLVTASYNNSLRLEGVKIGNNIIPTDSVGQVIVPFRGKSFTFPYYSAIDVLDKKIPTGALQGKIIFVGTSAIGIGDLRPTAIQSVFPGVEIQATVTDGILKNNFLYKTAWMLGVEVFITVTLGILFIFIFPTLGPQILSLLIVLIPLVLMIINIMLREKTGLIISILIPISFIILLAMLNIIFGYVFEKRRRDRLKNMFGQYVPAKHIDAMLKSSSNYGLLGEDREMTVLFADIRNFTAITEPMAAKQVKELLNEFFTPMTEIIFKHSGTIDKYVGDLIMAFWGAPLKDHRHAEHAISAALEMQEKVARLKSEFTAKNLPEINIGIGLNTGNMTVGDMGSKFRRNYTVLGDAVNLASRVESLSKYYDVKIIVTENTQKNQNQFIFRQLDRVRVKGKKTAINIYEVICKLTSLSNEMKKELESYEMALDYYYHQRWDKAFVLFRELSKTYPGSKIYALYLARVSEFKLKPPPENWDGVYIHSVK